MAEVCVSCKAPVVWAQTVNGKLMPVDAEPVSDGTILLSHRQAGEPPVALVQDAAAIEQLRTAHEHSPQERPLRLFVSHFATCPHAGQHQTGPGPGVGEQPSQAEEIAEREVSSSHDLRLTYSRVTILDRQSLFVTGSQGDFASSVLEEIVQEHIPAYTHNPPTLILLESDLDFEIDQPSELAADLFSVLREHMDRCPD